MYGSIGSQSFWTGIGSASSVRVNDDRRPSADFRSSTLQPASPAFALAAASIVDVADQRPGPSAR